MRFLKEFFKPALKCKRLGHTFVNKKTKIRREGSGRSICNDFMVDIPTCKRCGHEHPPINEKYLTFYTSVQMPTEYWDEMKKNGFIKV